LIGLLTSPKPDIAEPGRFQDDYKALASGKPTTAEPGRFPDDYKALASD